MRWTKTELKRRTERRTKHGPYSYCFATPMWVRRAIIRDYGYPALDVCASHGKHFGRKWYGPKEDGLKQNWTADGLGGIVFCNPPYTTRHTGDWVRKCHAEAEKGCIVVALLPLWRNYLWLDYAFAHAEIRFAQRKILCKGFGPMKGKVGGSFANDFESFVAVFRKGQTGKCGDWLSPYAEKKRQ